MHMTDALLSPLVGGAMCAAGVAANAYCVKKVRNSELTEKNIPVTGVMGAFVFAAQMINFTIPLTGASGHIGGGILLAAMLGWPFALLSISAVLIIQCLFFADGGLLALGCNIFNLGVVPCLIVYPLVFKPMLKKGLTPRRLSAASAASCITALQIGAFGVVCQTYLSRVTALPFLTFLALMQPIHLAIGIAEGVITAGILCFINQTRPDILDGALCRAAKPYRFSIKGILIVLGASALFIGAVLSLFASPYPDGLEWARQKAGIAAEAAPDNPVAEVAGNLREAAAVMPGYDFKNPGDESIVSGTSVSGIAGAALTFVLSGAAALVVVKVKKRE